MMYEIAENQVLERSAMVAVCPNSMRKQVLDTNAGPFLCFCAAGRVKPAGILLKLR